jgi:Prokaryotic E2 family E
VDVLLPADKEHLDELGLDYEVTSEDGLICVVIKDWQLPSGYEPARVDLLLRLPVGFPDAQPDMYWCDPPVRVAANGAFPPAADLMENYLGRTWQRFSRHLPGGAWQSARDNLGSYLALIHRGLAKEVGSQP